MGDSEYYKEFMGTYYVIARCSKCQTEIKKCSICGELFKPGDEIDCNYLVDKHSHVTCRVNKV